METPDGNPATARSNRSGKWLPFLILLGVLFVFSLAVMWLNHAGATWADRAAIGDSFGVANALFSGFAVASVKRWKPAPGPLSE